MKIHEYQAKEILQHSGCLIPKGKIAYTPLEAKKNALAINSDRFVIKAQIHYGDRKKGYFPALNDKISGIEFCSSPEEVYKISEKMLWNKLVTAETPNGGQTVSRVYVEEYCACLKKFYCALTIDANTAKIVLVLADIQNETINKDKLLKLKIPLAGVDMAIAEKGAEFLRLDVREFYAFIKALFSAFVANDALVIEINPAGVVKDQKIYALNAKMFIDDAALKRHKELNRYIDEDERSLIERKASEFGFVYHEYDGNIGCIVNGDGLALGLIGLLRQNGADPACTLNLKGGVDRDKIAAGIKLIAINPKVEGIIINIIGGFVRCDLIADGIVDAAAEVGINVPLVVRMEGTNALQAQNILQNSKLKPIMAKTSFEAVQKIAEAVKEVE